MPSAIKQELKYLFFVTYNDGTTFAQNFEDVSNVDPKKSAYYDVNQNEIKQFGLYDPRDNADNLEVDLTTGKFSNGLINISLGDNPGPKPYKLIFYRQHTHNFNVGDMEELSHIVKYCIGYTDADGVEHKVYID